MGVIVCKCTNCGGPLEFKAQTQNWICDYCLSEFTEAEVQAFLNNEQSQSEATMSEESLQQKQEKDEEFAEKATGYSCQSCGAEIVTDDTVAATFCYYCHNPAINRDAGGQRQSEHSAEGVGGAMGRQDTGAHGRRRPVDQQRRVQHVHGSGAHGRDHEGEASATRPCRPVLPFPWPRPRRGRRPRPGGRPASVGERHQGEGRQHDHCLREQGQAVERGAAGTDRVPDARDNDVKSTMGRAVVAARAERRTSTPSAPRSGGRAVSNGAAAASLASAPTPSRRSTSPATSARRASMSSRKARPAVTAVGCPRRRPVGDAPFRLMCPPPRTRRRRPTRRRARRPGERAPP